MNQFAVISLIITVLSASALNTSFSPIYSIAAAILALVFGIIALLQKNRKGISALVLMAAVVVLSASAYTAASRSISASTDSEIMLHSEEGNEAELQKAEQLEKVMEDLEGNESSENEQ